MHKIICLMIIAGIISFGSSAFAEIQSGDKCNLQVNKIIAVMYQGGLIRFVKVISPQEVTVVVPINKEEANQMKLAVKTDWHNGFVVLIEEKKPAPEKTTKHYFYAPLSSLSCKGGL